MMILSILLSAMRWMAKKIVQFIASIGHDFAKKAFVTVGAKVLVIFIPTIFAAKGAAAGYDFVTEKLFGMISAKDQEINFLREKDRVHYVTERKLRDSINTISAAGNYFDANAFREEVTVELKNQFDNSLSVVKNELEAAHRDIVQLTVTIINLQSVNRKAEIIDHKIDDGFIRGSLTRDSIANKDSLDYQLTMKIRETVLTSEGEEGDREEVYNIFAVSSKDSNDAILLDNSHRRSFFKVQKPEDVSLMWIDYAINGDVIVGNNLSAAISFTPFMITSGGRATKAVLVRYPELGIIIDGVSIFTGARFNVGHFLPLVQSTYLSPKVGYSIRDKGAVLRLGIGTVF